MIKKIIACADIHIRSMKRQEETVTILNQLFEDIKTEMEGYDPSEVRIVVAGDIYESKVDVTNEGLIMINWFIKQLDGIAKTIVIAGNHDYQASDLERVDTLSTIFGLGSFNQTIYLDKALEYSSGYYEDDNVVWCLYSTFDMFRRPEITAAKHRYPDHKYIGLIHGEVTGSHNDLGYEYQNGIAKSEFRGLDFVIAGHIHRHQELKQTGTKIVYCSSVIQQRIDENISGHGFVVWNVEDNTYIFKEVDNNGFGQYLLKIESPEDVTNGTEQFLNP